MSSSPVWTMKWGSSMSDIKSFTPKQAASVKMSDARLNIWEGSVRSSKTVCSEVRWIQFVLHGPPGNLLMVGKTERTLKRNIIDPLIDMLGKQRCRYIAGAGEVILMGRRIYVVGANDESAQEKIRGLTLAGAYVDEVSLVPESFWSMLLSRLSVKGAKLFGTTNPDNPAHWLKKELDRPAVWVDRNNKVHRQEIGSMTHKGKVLNLARFSFKLRDNVHLPPEYIEALEQEYTGLWYRRFILGEWVAAEGAIYPDFDPDAMVYSGEMPVASSGFNVVGMDYGTTNPTAGVFVQLGVDRKFYVTHEWAPPASTDAALSKRYLGWMQDELQTEPHYVFLDPAAASFHRQLHEDAVRHLGRANNAVLPGIKLLASLIAKDRLRIHEDCKNLLDELPGYSWDDKASKRGEDKPLKENDHWCDALRYAIHTTRPVWAREGAMP